jgi:hypothetical protein
LKRAIRLFGAIGGLGVPVVFTLAGWMLRSFAPDAAGALALLHGMQLPLWPMSKLIQDDPSGKHWLYLPLAAVLSNALLYAIVGVASVWGRKNRGVFLALPVAVVGLLFVAAHGFGSGPAGFLLAAAVAVAGLVVHHRCAAC